MYRGGKRRDGRHNKLTRANKDDMDKLILGAGERTLRRNCPHTRSIENLHLYNPLLLVEEGTL
jgi:hypothetical protein